MKWEGRRNRVWGGGKDSQFLKFTDWIEKPKESILAVTLEIKAAQKSPGWARLKARHFQPPAGRAQQRGAKAQPLRPPREARPPPPNPGFADCHSGWTMPKDSTANIFFINIFLFFISGLTPIKGCGKRAPAAALPLTSALNPLPTLIEWVLRMWLCNTAISKQCFW